MHDIIMALKNNQNTYNKQKANRQNIIWLRYYWVGNRIAGHISGWTHFGWVTIAFGKFTSTQLLPNTSMMTGKIFDWTMSVHTAQYIIIHTAQYIISI